MHYECGHFSLSRNITILSHRIPYKFLRLQVIKWESKWGFLRADLLFTNNVSFICNNIWAFLSHICLGSAYKWCISPFEKNLSNCNFSWNMALGIFDIKKEQNEKKKTFMVRTFFYRATKKGSTEHAAIPFFDTHPNYKNTLNFLSVWWNVFGKVKFLFG